MLNVTTSNQEKVAAIQVTSKSNASIDNIIVGIYYYIKIIKNNHRDYYCYYYYCYYYYINIY